MACKEHCYGQTVRNELSMLQECADISSFKYDHRFQTNLVSLGRWDVHETESTLIQTHIWFFYTLSL